RKPFTTPTRWPAHPPTPGGRGDPVMVTKRKSQRTRAASKRSALRARRFDMAMIQRGARLRRSPFFDKTWEAGCKAFTVYNHTFLPSYYDDPVKEYWHLLRHVALRDAAVARNGELIGPA